MLFFQEQCVQVRREGPAGPDGPRLQTPNGCPLESDPFVTSLWEMLGQQVNDMARNTFICKKSSEGTLKTDTDSKDSK